MKQFVGIAVLGALLTIGAPMASAQSVWGDAIAKPVSIIKAFFQSVWGD